MMTRAGKDLASLDHACAVPISDEQLWEMTAEFVGAGLSAREQVTYFDDGTVDAVLERLDDNRVPVADSLQTGQLTVVASEHTQAALRSPLEAVRETVLDLIDSSIESGWTGFRMTGQFSYGLHRAGGIGLPEYDAALADVLRGRPARLLCFFDRRHYPDEAIGLMRSLHDKEIDAPAIYDDNLLRITSIGPAAVRLAGEVDHSNRPRIRRLLETTLDQAQRSHDAPTDITLDLSSLRFLDVAGAVSLVHTAEEFPSTHRLVLTGVRQRVLRVLDRCGAPFAAQLTVEPRPEPREQSRGGAMP